MRNRLSAWPSEQDKHLFTLWVAVFSSSSIFFRGGCQISGKHFGLLWQNMRTELHQFFNLWIQSLQCSFGLFYTLMDLRNYLSLFWNERQWIKFRSEELWNIGKWHWVKFTTQRFCVQELSIQTGGWPHSFFSFTSSAGCNLLHDTIGIYSSVYIYHKYWWYHYIVLSYSNSEVVERKGLNT